MVYRDRISILYIRMNIVMLYIRYIYRDIYKIFLKIIMYIYCVFKMVCIYVYLKLQSLDKNFYVDIKYYDFLKYRFLFF